MVLFLTHTGGFSRQICEILKEHDIPFASFDILTDDEVRSGLKTHSDWPTYPQLYGKYFFFLLLISFLLLIVYIVVVVVVVVVVVNSSMVQSYNQ